MSVPEEVAFSQIPNVFKRDSPFGNELVMINLKAQPFRTDLPLACLIHVRVLTCDPADPSNPSWEEIDILDGCHQIMSNYLEDKCPGLFVARATNAVWRTTCFCMEPQVPQPDSLLHELQRRYPDRQVTMEYFQDPDWTIYQQFYPSPIQMGEIMDNKILYSMRQRNANLMLARPVNHTAEFSSEAAAQSFLQAITPHGFEVEGVGQAEDDEAVWGVEFERTEILGSENFIPLLAWLRTTVTHFEGEYVGWGAGYSANETA
jgi:hypothetical protein